MYFRVLSLIVLFPSITYIPESIQQKKFLSESLLALWPDSWSHDHVSIKYWKRGTIMIYLENTLEISGTFPLVQDRYFNQIMDYC
jgi:hypothetical protein